MTDMVHPDPAEEDAGLMPLIAMYATEEVRKFCNETGHVCPMCLTLTRTLYTATRDVYSAITLATALAGAEAWQRTGGMLEDLRQELQAAKRILVEHNTAFEAWQGRSPRHGYNHHPAREPQIEGQTND